MWRRLIYSVHSVIFKILGWTHILTFISTLANTMKDHIVCAQGCLAKAYEGQSGERFGIIDKTTLILPRNTHSLDTVWRQAVLPQAFCRKDIALLQRDVHQPYSPVLGHDFSHLKQRKQGSWEVRHSVQEQRGSVPADGWGTRELELLWPVRVTMKTSKDTIQENFYAFIPGPHLESPA